MAQGSRFFNDQDSKGGIFSAVFSSQEWWQNGVAHLNSPQKKQAFQRESIYTTILLIETWV